VVTWVDITAPHDLEQCNDTAVARVLGGFVYARTWWNPKTKVVVTRLYTQAGNEKRKAKVGDE
jgi:hypothetical protein